MLDPAPPFLDPPPTPPETYSSCCQPKETHWQPDQLQRAVRIFIPAALKMSANRVTTACSVTREPKGRRLATRAWRSTSLARALAGSGGSDYRPEEGSCSEFERRRPGEGKSGQAAAPFICIVGRWLQTLPQARRRVSSAPRKQGAGGAVPFWCTRKACLGAPAPV